jgi:hypothetical protein
VMGAGLHDLQVRLQLAPEMSPASEGDEFVAGQIRIGVDDPRRPVFRAMSRANEPGGAATAFGAPLPASPLELQIRAELPTTWTFVIETEGTS